MPKLAMLGRQLPFGDERSSYRISILLLLAASQALAYIDRINLSVAGPELIRLHHASPARLGVLFSIFNWAFTVSLLFAGPLTDRLRPRIAYPAGVILWSVATGLCGLTTWFLPLAIFRAFVGIGEAPMIPSGARVIRETYPQEQRAYAIGVFFAGNKVGLAFGLPLASIAYAYFGWPGVFYSTAALGLIWAAAWVIAYRPPDRSYEAAATTNGLRPIRWRDLLRYRTTWGLMFGQAGYLYIYYLFVSWLPGYLLMQRHMSMLKTGFVGMLPFLIGIGCTILGGWLSDRLVKSGMRVTYARKLFAVGGLLAATLFIIIGAYTPSTVLAVGLLTLAVAGFSFATASANAMSLDAAPPHIVSSLVSLQNFGGNVGGSFAPVVTGFLISQSGNFSVALVVAGIIALLFGCGGFGLLVGNIDRELQSLAPVPR